MATTVLDIIRLSKHKDASTYFQYDWSTYLRTGDSLSVLLSDHTFEVIDTDSGLAVTNKAVSGNSTYCTISGGTSSIAEWRIKIAAKGTSSPAEIGVIELWIAVWG